jgi:CRP-like cAMP-binding protein
MTSGWLQGRVLMLLGYHDLLSDAAADTTRILRMGKRARFEADDLICAEGAEADAMYVVLEGQVRMSLADQAGEQHDVAVIDGPAILGHVGLLDGTRRAATYRALVACTVVALSRGICERLLASNASIGATFRHLLVSSLSQQLSARNVRLRAVLERIAEDGGSMSSTASGAAPAGRGGRRSRSKWALPDHMVGEETEADLMQMARVSEGWNVDVKGMSDVKVVKDEAQRRNPAGGRRRG